MGNTEQVGEKILLPPELSDYKQGYNIQGCFEIDVQY